jgi:hypothetical protein
LDAPHPKCKNIVRAPVFIGDSWHQKGTKRAKKPEHGLQSTSPPIRNSRKRNEFRAPFSVFLRLFAANHSALLRLLLFRQRQMPVIVALLAPGEPGGFLPRSLPHLMIAFFSIGIPALVRQLAVLRVKPLGKLLGFIFPLQRFAPLCPL